MKLTTKTRYSLRILIQLAQNYQKLPVRGKDISVAQKISEPYLEQIMISLKSAGYVGTLRGCNGGYILDVPPEDVTVLNLLELFEGKIQFSDCSNSDSSPCSLFYSCPTTKIWDKLSKVLIDEASQVSLATILEEINKPQSQEYVI